jgi:hypothetical protein
MVEGEATAGLGRVSDQQLSAATKLLKEQSIRPDNHTILAVIHHHLLPIWHVEDILNPSNPMAAPIGRASITVDAVEVLRNLASWGVSAVLHGHQHRHSVLTYEDHVRADRPIHILAAGSAGDKTAQRQFMYMKFDAVRLTYCRTASPLTIPRNSDHFGGRH